MKKIIPLIILGFIISNSGYSQCAPANTQNISVTSATINPNPLQSVEANGSGTACFIFDSSQGVSLCPGEEIQVTVCLNKFEFTGPPTATDPSIFDSWAVDFFAPNCYVGTISHNLGFLSGTQICFDVDVTENSVETDAQEAQNNMNINITPHAGDNIGDSDDDTFVSTYTMALVPVEWLAFDAVKKDETSVLSWSTATEIDNDKFEVYRSLNGVDWEIIGSVKGSGTTSDQNDYQFVDRNPNSGNNYYQLKQIDFDGHFELSDIRLVRFDRGNLDIEFNVFPNPTVDKIKISSNVDIKGHSVKVLSATGTLIKHVSLENDPVINLEKYTSGIYYVVLIGDDNKRVKIEKIVKF